MIVFTLIGLVCHYFIEYGEKSVVMAFTIDNIVLYILVVVIYTCALYSIVEIRGKWVIKKAVRKRPDKVNFNEVESEDWNDVSTED